MPLLWDPTFRTTDEDLVLGARSAAQCGPCWPLASITAARSPLTGVHPRKLEKRRGPFLPGGCLLLLRRGCNRGWVASPHPGCCLVGVPPAPQMETLGLNFVLS